MENDQVPYVTIYKSEILLERADFARHNWCIHVSLEPSKKLIVQFPITINSSFRVNSWNDMPRTVISVVTD